MAPLTRFGIYKLVRRHTFAAGFRSLFRWRFVVF